MPGVNGFRDDELVVRKQKINGEWSETSFPRVGGRLRLAHEGNGKFSIQTELIRFEESWAVVKATAITDKGSFCGFGTASTQRDARLADSLLELAETRSIARALRFSGYGVEYTGAEEVSHTVPDNDHSSGQNEPKRSENVFPEREHAGERETKTQEKRAASNGNAGKATQAQCRALYALVRKAKICEEDLASMLSPMDATTFEELTIADASRLIQNLQTEVAA